MECGYTNSCASRFHSHTACIAATYRGDANYSQSNAHSYALTGLA